MDKDVFPHVLEQRTPNEFVWLDMTQGSALWVLKFSSKAEAEKARTAFVSGFSLALSVIEDMSKVLAAIVDHAKKKYPHFESERGQREIKFAISALKKAEQVGEGRF